MCLPNLLQPMSFCQSFSVFPNPNHHYFYMKIVKHQQYQPNSIKVARSPNGLCAASVSGWSPFTFSMTPIGRQQRGCPRQGQEHRLSSHVARIHIPGSSLSRPATSGDFMNISLMFYLKHSPHLHWIIVRRCG